MIDHITTGPLAGHFTLNGSTDFAGDVLQLFRDGVKATPKARAILAKWAKEADAQAAANEKAWDEFNARYPFGVY
jgi:hypothetical protein